MEQHAAQCSSAVTKMRPCDCQNSAVASVVAFEAAETRDAATRSAPASVRHSGSGVHFAQRTLRPGESYRTPQTSSGSSTHTVERGNTVGAARCDEVAMKTSGFVEVVTRGPSCRRMPGITVPAVLPEPVGATTTQD